MAKLTLFDMNLAKRLQSELGGKRLSIDLPKSKDLQFELVVEVDGELLAKLDDDPRFVDNARKRVGVIYNKMIKTAVKRILEASDAAHEEHKRGKSSRPIRKKLASELDTKVFWPAEIEMEKAFRQDLEAWKKVREDRKGYRAKFTKSIVVNAVGFTVAAAGVGAGAASLNPAGIAAIVVGIQSGGKAIVTAAKQVSDAGRDIHTIARRLEKGLQELAKSYESGMKKKETAAAFIEEFTGVQKKSIGKAKSDLDTFGRKLTNLHKAATDLGKKLNDALVKQAELDKAIDKVRGQLGAGHAATGSFKKLDQANRKQKQVIEKAIKEMPDLDRDIDQFEKAKKECQASFVALDKNQPNWFKVGKVAIKLLPVAASAGANIGGIGAAMAVHDVVVATATGANDLRAAVDSVESELGS